MSEKKSSYLDLTAENAINHTIETRSRQEFVYTFKYNGTTVKNE